MNVFESCVDLKEGMLGERERGREVEEEERSGRGEALPSIYKFVRCSIFWTPPFEKS